jgi:DNA-binding GntR family transcriptional regulator
LTLRDGADTIREKKMIRRIKRRPEMADAVVDELRAAILSGSLPPGTRIRQEDLAERLRVSRAPVRQAFVVLRHEGLIVSDGVRGAMVAPLNAEIICELYGFRGIVESAVAATLAERSDFDSTRLEVIIVQGRRAASKGDIGRLVKLDCDFHMALYRAVKNSVLLNVMKSQWTHVRRLMSATLSMSGYPPRVWDEHAAILAAIVAHDAVRAARLSAEHPRAATEQLIRNLDGPVITRGSAKPVGRRYSRSPTG